MQLKKKYDIVSCAVTWHTMKREVAKVSLGFFRGECPILEIGRQSLYTKYMEGKTKRSFYAYLCPDSSMSGFMFVKT